MILARFDRRDGEEVRFGLWLEVIRRICPFDSRMNHDDVRALCLRVVLEQTFARVVRNAHDRAGLLPDRRGKHGRPIAHGGGGKPFWVVEEKDVVNRQQEALTAENQGPVITEMHQVGATRDDRKVELLEGEAAQARGGPTRSRAMLKLAVFGVLEASTDDDQLVARRERRGMDAQRPRTIVPTPREAP